MKRTFNSRSSLFLIELIIAILFFSLVSAVCLKAFTRSHILNQDARDLNAALMRVESTAELLKAGESVEEKTYYSSSWNTCKEPKAAYVISINEVSTSDTDNTVSEDMKYYKVTAKNLDTRKKIYSLRVTCHIPLRAKEAAGHE